MNGSNFQQTKDSDLKSHAFLSTQYITWEAVLRNVLNKWALIIQSRTACLDEKARLPWNNMDE